MKISLIKGAFEAEDLLEIITQMIHVKIKFHEEQIKFNDSEEHMKMREKRIVELQRDLFELRNVIKHNPKKIIADAEINIEFIKNKTLA